MAKKRKCAFCNKPATRVFTPLLGTIPREPQGDMEFKINGSSILCCDKHELSHECVKLESYPQKNKNVCPECGRIGKDRIKACYLFDGDKNMDWHPRHRIDCGGMII